MNPGDKSQPDRQSVERASLDCLLDRRFRDARLVVNEYCAARYGQAGFIPAGQDELLSAIFKSYPTIIHSVTARELGVLRVAAAMMEIWGTNTARGWWPDGFTIHSHLDPDAAARMVLFSAQHRLAIERYRTSGVDAVEWLIAPDACDACKEFSGKRYRGEEPMPEMPYPHCTHPMGCRCTSVPYIDWDARHGE